MSCSSCSQTTGLVTGFNPASCISSTNCGTDAGCIIYTGPALGCSSISTYDTLDIILQKIDSLLCSSSGDYSTYNTYCLSPITTQKQFVETISNYVCNTNTTLTTFINTTFPVYQVSVTNAINVVNNPSITCAAAGVTTADNLPSVLTKYCTLLSSINTNLDLSTVNWSQCYTVSPTPTTLTEGFNTLIGQICLLKAQVASSTGALPTFNNTANCLAGGASDSLVTTIGLLTTRVCQTGTLNNATITWGCVTQPAGAQDLQSTLQNIITQLTTVSQAEPMTWSNDFTITNVNNGNLCLGKHVALAVPSTQDRFVAATPSDTSPATLQGKLTAGTNVTLDYTTTPGQVIINATGGTGIGDHKVLADSTDTVADYLINKIGTSGVTSGISVQPILDASNPSHIVSLQVSVDPVALFTSLITAATSDSGLAAALCALIASCPSPCAAPNNVTVTYNSGGTTTTTTTTSTTTTTTTTV